LKNGSDEVSLALLPLLKKPERRGSFGSVAAGAVGSRLLEEERGDEDRLASMRLALSARVPRESLYSLGRFSLAWLDILPPVRIKSIT
jgi:hypothetical protein